MENAKKVSMTERVNNALVALAEKSHSNELSLSEFIELLSVIETVSPTPMKVKGIDSDRISIYAFKTIKKNANDNYDVIEELFLNL